jgi:hypothetical protein
LTVIVFLGFIVVSSLGKFMTTVIPLSAPALLPFHGSPVTARRSTERASADRLSRFLQSFSRLSKRMLVSPPEAASSLQPTPVSESEAPSTACATLISSRSAFHHPQTTLVSPPEAASSLQPMLVDPPEAPSTAKITPVLRPQASPAAITTHVLPRREWFPVKLLKNRPFSTISP